MIGINQTKRYYSDPDSDRDSSARFQAISDKMDNRIERMFKPMAHTSKAAQQRSAQHYGLHSSSSQHERDSTRDSNRYVQQREQRNSKREQLKLGRRGAMDEFVLKQEEEELKRQLARDAKLHEISDPDNYLEDDDNENDKAYDADDDDDFVGNVTAERQLEEMLCIERMELEEMTENLTLDG